MTGGGVGRGGGKKIGGVAMCGDKGGGVLTHGREGAVGDSVRGDKFPALDGDEITGDKTNRDGVDPELKA